MKMKRTICRRLIRINHAVVTKRVARLQILVDAQSLKLDAMILAPVGTDENLKSAVGLKGF